MDKIEQAIEPYLTDSQCSLISNMLLSTSLTKEGEDDPVDVEMLLALKEVLDEHES